jgi:hypothetical protein
VRPRLAVALFSQFVVLVYLLRHLKFELVQMNREVVSSSDEEDDDGAGARRPGPPQAKARPSSSLRSDGGPSLELSPLDPAFHLDFGHS